MVAGITPLPALAGLCVGLSSALERTMASEYEQTAQRELLEFLSEVERLRRKRLVILEICATLDRCGLNMDDLQKVISTADKSSV